MNESEPKAVVEHSVEAAVGRPIEHVVPGRDWQEKDAFYGATDLFRGLTGYDATPFDIWLLGRGVMTVNGRSTVRVSSGSVTKRGEANEQGLSLALSVLAWSNEEDRRGPRVEEFKLKVIKEASAFVDSVGASVQRPAEDGTR